MGSATGFRYGRLLLKLSGEALVGKAGYGIDVDVVMRLCREMKEAVAAEEYEQASQLRDEIRKLEKSREDVPS